MYILLTRISNVTVNPQLVLFDRLPILGYTCVFVGFSQYIMCKNDVM